MTTTPNWLKGIYHGIGYFLLAGGASLVSLIPQSIGAMSIESLVVAVIAWAGHALASQ